VWQSQLQGCDAATAGPTWSQEDQRTRAISGPLGEGGLAGADRTRTAGAGPARRRRTREDAPGAAGPGPVADVAVHR
jgi:hypothetical protein